MKAHSPAYFEDSYDTADAVPIATSDPLVLKKGVPPSWGQDLYEGVLSIIIKFILLY